MPFVGGGVDDGDAEAAAALDGGRGDPGVAALHHRVADRVVEPVTRGTRIASFFWIESMVRSDEQRRLLFDMDTAIIALRNRHGDTDESVRLTGVYHNLLRLWAET